MFLPISDAPNPRGTPFATWTLIAVNVALFVFVNVPLGAQRANVQDPEFREYVEFLSQQVEGASPRQIAQQASAYDLFVFKHGYRPAEPSVTDLLFAMFLHGGFMHLFGNMLFLWIYGDNVEKRLGAIPFVLWYLLTGAAATLFHAAVFSTSNVPLVGASGAISGVLGFYFVWFPRNTVRALIFLPPFLMQVIQIPARFVLGIYLLLDNLLPFLFAGEGGVAHGAHIGGFLAGGAVAWVMDRFTAARAPRGIETPRERPAGVAAVRDALAAGRYEEAATAYFALPGPAARGALAPEEAVALGTWLRQHGHADAALVLVRRVVRDTPRGPGLAEVYALAGSILLEDKHQAPAAYQYLLTALELGPQPQTAAEVRRQLEAIEGAQRLHPGRFRRH
jgi:membrane associated rhomboid family serine protease